MSNPNLDRITFSDLEAFVPKRKPQPVIESPAPQPVRSKPSPVDEYIEVKPPSLGRFFFVGFLLFLMTGIAFAGWRLQWDWQLLQNDPVLAVNVVVGLRHKPAAPVVPPPAPPQPEQMRGELKAQDLTVMPRSDGPKRTLQLRGVIKNGTNRIQRAITLKASLVDPDGLKVASQRVQCCTHPKSGGTEGKHGKSPHPSPSSSPETVLQPGESASFAVNFDGHGADDGFKPIVEVAFSEAERVP